MTLPDLAPRGAFGGILAVWILAALAGVAVGLFAPVPARAGWLAVALAGSLALSFAVQLWYGRAYRFVFRVAAGVLGALVLLGIASIAFALASIVPGIG